MRITTYLPKLAAIGGVELSVLQATRELAGRGHQIDLFYENDGDLTEEFSSFCEAMLRGGSPLTSRSPWKDLGRVAGRAFAARRPRPDLIFVNNISELGWANVVSALTGAPIICHSHEFRAVRPATLSILGARVHRFVVSSQFMRRCWTAHGIDDERIEVIPAGFAPGDYPRGTAQDRLDERERLGLAPDAFVALYAGRVIAEKGVDVLIDAWAALSLPSNRGRLVIVGAPVGPDEYADALRARAPQDVLWLPLSREVVGLLHASDVLVLPSMWEEPFGRVVLEAMATGRPAVASAVGGIPELLDGEFTGMLFPRGDHQALAERLAGLRNWRSEDPSLEDRCVAHVSERFTLDAEVTRLEELFKSAVGSHRRAVRRRPASQALVSQKPFKLGIVVLAHRKPEQLASLLEALRHPQVTVYLHIDRNSKLEPFRAAVANADVGELVWVKRHRLSWGQRSIVDAELEGIAAALADDCSYLLLISGEDFPVRPIAEIVEFTQANQARSYVDAVPLSQAGYPLDGRKRTEFYSWKVGGRLYTCIPRGEDTSAFDPLRRSFNWAARARFIGRTRRRFPTYVKAFGGQQWLNLSVPAASYVLDFVEAHPDYHKYHRFTACADELYVQSILLGSDFATSNEIVRDDLRFLIWEGGDHPKTLTLEDLPAIESSSDLFARKVDGELNPELLVALQQRAQAERETDRSQAGSPQPDAPVS